MSDDLTCRKCGETYQKGVDLSRHYRVVHGGPLQLGLADRRSDPDNQAKEGH